MQREGEVTRLLDAAGRGDAGALDRLLPLVYDDLRWLARRQLRAEHGARTIATTELVHEAYLKLAGHGTLPAQSRRHFYGSAARAMRQVLIDAARQRGTRKREGRGNRVDLDGCEIAVDACAEDLVALDEALHRLSAMDARLAQIVECRFFGGLSVEETAEVVDVSPRTVKREWRKARAWLYQALAGT